MNKDLAWTIVAAGAALAVSAASRRALEGGWRLTTGDDPPKNPAAPDVTWGQALTWAAASAMVVAVGRLVAHRGAAAGWEQVVGAPPPFEDE